jgi:hypothetical protein
VDVEEHNAMTRTPRALLSLVLMLTTLLSAQAPSGVAYAAAADNMQVWRAQVRLVTGNGNLHADTDDDIQVALSDANRTWLDYGRNDFEVVDDFTYDLLLTNVRTLADIEYLTVQKTGTDGWCVDNLTLLINGQAIYYRSFRSSTALCHWVDADDGHSPTFTISRSTLRSHALWQGYTTPTRPQRLTRGELESRVEATLGDWIESHDDDYKWGHLNGPRYVEATPTNASGMHFDLDLTAINNNAPDGELDIDFDLRFTCSGGRLRVEVLNLGVREHTPYRLDDPVPHSNPELRDRLQAQLTAPLRALNAMLSITAVPPCPSVLVDGGGNVMVPQLASGPNVPEPQPTY